jgi:serine/threonine-protein kinase
VSLQPGTHLGPYEITAAIGAGGMGEVYRAKDTTLGRDVAIKILPAAFAHDADRLARFTREAKTLASLNHPNIAHIYGLDRQEGQDGRDGTARPATVFIVMELVEGDDLSQRITRSAIPLDEALPIAKQIVDALEAAHELGIVHRDLKPANIKVRADGTVKVLDFGLAKALGPAEAGHHDDPRGVRLQADLTHSPTITTPAMTQAGMILGTAAYMSPEQARGKAVDKRADIWAFGVVLYEMLTGARTFAGDDVSITLASVLKDEVRWDALPSGTPPRLRRLLERCLERDAKQRLRDIGEARVEIGKVQSGAPDATLAGTTRAGAVSVPAPSSRWSIATLGFAAIGFAALSGWLLLSRKEPAPPPVTRARLANPVESSALDISRDGTKLVYRSGNAAQGYVLLLRQMDQFEGKPLAGTDGGARPVFSPSADWIAYSADNKIKKTPASGGTSIALCGGDFNTGGAWGDDDTIVFSGKNGLMRVPATGGTPVVLTTIETTKGEVQHQWPQFLPGGRQLLFTVASKSAEGPQFAVLDLQSGKYRVVARGGEHGQYVRSGHLTFGRGRTLFALPFDLARLAPTGTEAPVVEDLFSWGGGGYAVSGAVADYAVSFAGTLVYVEATAQTGSVLSWADRTGVAAPLPGQIPRLWGSGRLSPDGRRVASGIFTDTGHDLWVVNLASGTPTRLTFGGVNDNPVWTPDGREIVYSVEASGKDGLHTLHADGSGQPALLLAGTGLSPASLTPDGKTLLFTQAGASGSRVMVLPLASPAGGKPHPLHDSTGSETGAAVSPDGQWVAFESRESGRSEVYVTPFPGAGPKTQVSTEGGVEPRWARSGRELFYWQGTSAGGNRLFSAAIQTAPFSASAPHPLFSANSGTTWDPAPDGEHFMFENAPAGFGNVFATVTNWFDELRRKAPAKK